MDFCHSIHIHEDVFTCLVPTEFKETKPAMEAKNLAQDTQVLVINSD